MKTSDYKSFAYLENGSVVFSQFETIKSSSKIDAGIYTVSYSDHPRYEVLLKLDPPSEKFDSYDFAHKEKLDGLFNSFFSQKTKERVALMGFKHKMGVLLYGREGTGKTSIIKHYCQAAVQDHDAIVFNLISYSGLLPCWDFIRNIRRIQRNPIIIFIDEIDGFMAKESEIKSIMDGSESIDNCVFFACTNYIDKIPNAISERPSRFKYCLSVDGIQSAQDIEVVIDNMIGDLIPGTQVKSAAESLKGSTLDEIKHYCLDVVMELSSYKPEKKRIGFNK